jgi:hypothetical protein
MKKIILGIVFLFTVSFAFAFTGKISPDSIFKIDGHYTCVTVNTSCGIVGSACGASTAGIIDAAIALENWVCEEL